MKEEIGACRVEEGSQVGQVEGGVGRYEVRTAQGRLAGWLQQVLLFFPPLALRDGTETGRPAPEIKTGEGEGGGKKGKDGRTCRPGKEMRCGVLKR